jgi:hypothetical protein
MKIFNINIYNTNNKANSKLNTNNQSIRNSYAELNYNSNLAPLNSDIVSFGKKKKTEPPVVKTGETLLYHRVYNELKNISNLPCGYCGEPMLSIPNRKRIYNSIKV